MREFLDKKKKVVCARRLRVSLVRLIIAGARNACNGKRYLPPSCVNYVGQDGNAVLPPFEKTRPVNVRVGREKRERKNKQTNKQNRNQQKAELVFLQRLTEAHHDVSIVKPGRRKDGHHGPRSSNGAALTNGKTKYTRYCCVCVQFHVLEPLDQDESV